MKIKAALFRQIHAPFSVESVDLDSPLAGEVLVKMKAVGICHSDWHLISGATPHPTPAVAGHEGAGLVEATGPGVTKVKAGDHVALNWAPSCGECFFCQNDRPALCATYLNPIWDGTMMDGTTRLSLNGKPVYHFSALASFAEYAVVPQECCVPLDPQVPWPVAALIGCAVTTGVGAALNTARVKKGSSVVVLGAGGVGLSILMGARSAGADPLIAVDRVPTKRTLSLDCGATHFIVPDGNLGEQIKSVTGARGADYVFEAVGDPSLQELSLELVRPGGVIVLAGISPVGSNTNLPGAIITRKELTILGSYYGTSSAARDFPHYAAMYLKGALPIDRMISYHYTLDQINDAYTDMLSGSIGRGVIIFQ